MSHGIGRLSSLQDFAGFFCAAQLLDLKISYKMWLNIPTVFIHVIPAQAGIQ